MLSSISQRNAGAVRTAAPAGSDQAGCAPKTFPRPLQADFVGVRLAKFWRVCVSAELEAHYALLGSSSMLRNMVGLPDPPRALRSPPLVGSSGDTVAATPLLAGDRSCPVAVT